MLNIVKHLIAEVHMGDCTVRPAPACKASQGPRCETLRRL